MTFTRIASRSLALVALALVAGCAQPQVEDVPLSGTLSDNNNPSSPTDSVYGTPPDPIPTVPPPPATASPTGRQPRLIWTAERQAIWNRMVAEGSPRWQQIEGKCNRAKAGSPAYGDRGLWCALVYQMTGDVSAARTAWQIAAPMISNPPPNANDVRENFIENAILFDWLYPALTAAEQAQAIAGLNGWGNYALAIGTPQYVGGMRTSDSDAMVGYYFGLAATDLATRGMPGHVDWLSATQTGGPGTLPVGGLTASGTDRSTARNTIREYVMNRAAGGQWIESSGYDMGTVQLLIMGVEAVRTNVAGADPFPEVQSFLETAIDFNAAIITGDLAQAVQWGDEEHPRDFQGRLYKRASLLAMLAGATAGTIESGRGMGLLDALGQRYGETGYNSAELNARSYLVFDPYAPRASWNSSSDYLATGMGHLVARTPSTLFSVMMTPRTGVDHELNYLTNFQLYRNGEWAVTNPLGYAGPSVEGESTNGLLVAGLSGMLAKGPIRAEAGAGWWAYTGATQGALYSSGYYQPPPVFLQQWQRTVVYLQRNGIDHIITVDWIQMQDPRSLPSFDRYRTSDRSRISAAPGLLQWIIHAPVPPAGSGHRWSWQTTGGQPVVVSALGTAPNVQVLDEHTLWSGTGNFMDSELHYQLRLVPAFTGGSTVLRHVVTVGETDPQVSVSGDTITIDGAQVTVTETGVQVIG